jgi:hypothetical protein
MKYLIRKKMLNRLWHPNDLEAVAAYWCGLGEAAATCDRRLPASPSLSVVIYLRGFPRQQAVALRDQLRARFSSSNEIPPPTVEQPDPDTLTVTFHQVPVGLGLPRLAEPPFDRLCAEVRLRLSGPEGTTEWPTDVPSEFVLLGEMRNGSILVAALWRAEPLGCGEKMWWSTEWLGQEEWLEGLEQFRRTGQVSQSSVQEFLLPGDSVLVRVYLWACHVPIDKPRFGPLLLRVTLFFAAMAGFGATAFFLLREGWWPVLIPLAIPMFVVLGLGGRFFQCELGLLVQGYQLFHRLYLRTTEVPFAVAPLAPEEAVDRLSNPWARKYTAELEAAGFTVVGDLILVPELNGDNVVRVFYAPDGVTYLNVLFQMSTDSDLETGVQTWPACVAFQAQTRLTDNGWVISGDGFQDGFRKMRKRPGCYSRLFLDVEDPVEFTRLHAKLADEFAQKEGRRILPHEPFPLVVQRANELEEEARLAFADAPYTWSDHLHWYLQIRRREYLS